MSPLSLGVVPGQRPRPIPRPLTVPCQHLHPLPGRPWLPASISISVTAPLGFPHAIKCPVYLHISCPVRGPRCGKKASGAPSLTHESKKKIQYPEHGNAVDPPAQIMHPRCQTRTAVLNLAEGAELERTQPPVHTRARALARHATASAAPAAAAAAAAKA